jgi:hypothetical protein
MALHMLTTVDNPNDPYTHWDEWDRWDQDAGYHTTALLGRVVLNSLDLSEPDQNQAYEDAMLQIVTENVSGMHKLVEVPD